MPNNKPKVSIGLPIYNGERYLEETLDSLLAQTYADFELIISDNGSTDGTERICQEYCARDSRIRYFRNQKNNGAARNYNRVFEFSSGEYFKWAAHDDVLSPTFVEKCVAALDSNPSLVLCFSWLIDIDEEGNELSIRAPTVTYDLVRPHERFRALSEVRPTYTCEAVFGLVRSRVLRKTKLIGSYSDSDRTLLAELGLHGPMYEIPEVLFLHRLHPQSSVKIWPGRQERTAWFDPAYQGRIVFPHWRQLAELLSVIWRSPVSWTERLYCYFHMLNWLKRGRRRLRRDLVSAIEHMH